MKFTPTFVQDRFRHFNEQIFQGALPEPPIVLCNVKTFLGKCTYKIRRRFFGEPEYYDFKLRFNQRIDLPENELEDIIIHEMIHYHIELNHLKDSSAHGRLFTGMMNRINQQYGRHIRISYKLTNDQRNELSGPQQPRIIAVITMNDGTRNVKVLPEDNRKILKYCRTLSSARTVRKVDLYQSDSPVFNRYPKSAAFNLFRIAPDDLDQALATAKPLSWK